MAATSLIECVPNVSEGQRQDVIDAMADAVRRVGDVTLLDYSGDTAHNRSVFTMVGTPPGLERAVAALYEQALPAIDLRTQRGVHPRLGAVDVVPFVPIASTPMSACVELARKVGADIAARYGVPVYLYGEAASSNARIRLEDIRRGQFEGLAAKMASPSWIPDFGPPAPHPTAGASVVGARLPLIAYNVNLATDRLEVARAIAAAVRESSGGLPSVKAMGVSIAPRGIVQVSMNLTDYRRTSLRDAFEAVRREGDRYGVAVLDSEIIGLVPSAALAGTSSSELRIRGFSPNMILEHRLRQLRAPG